VVTVGAAWTFIAAISKTLVRLRLKIWLLNSADSVVGIASFDH
jgi:hypothetical protein